jgi:hypothetical protein
MRSGWCFKREVEKDGNKRWYARSAVVCILKRRETDPSDIEADAWQIPPSARQN